MRKLTLLSGIAAAAVLLPSAGLAHTVRHVPHATPHVPDMHTTLDLHDATDTHAVVRNALAPADAGHNMDTGHMTGHGMDTGHTTGHGMDTGHSGHGVDTHQLPPPPPPPVHPPHG
jgi:hypothetical protein